ncbi:MAG: hypothetical protein QG621_404 [Patescibacteria group bacterium]|jgi:hypothetical protein|nr:hypothetical protein [Patescibacteria group bacterium]
MINDQLLTYIKDNLHAGYTKADIEVSLRTAGWDAADIATAFSALAGPTPTIPAPGTPTAQPSSIKAGSAQSDVDVELARIQAELQKAHKGSAKIAPLTEETGIIGWMLRKKMVSSKNQANSVLIVLAVVFLGLAAWIAFT